MTPTSKIILACYIIYFNLFYLDKNVFRIGTQTPISTDQHRGREDGGKGRETKATKNCKQKVGRDKGIDIDGQQGGRKGPKINGKNVDMINSIEV